MKNLLLTLLSVYLVMMVLLFLLQRKLMYFPTSEPAQSDYEVIALASDGGQIKVVTDNQDEEHAIIYFGGNAENVWWTPRQLQEVFEGYAVYYLNYPGYGGSTGSPTEATIIQAASDLYAYVKQRHPSISLAGRSLGTGVAVAVASQNEVSGVILISPYDSIANVAAGHYPIFPTRWLVKDKFDSLNRIDKIKADILVLVASEDKVVPAKHSLNLVEGAGKLQHAVDVSVLQGYHHNNIDSAPEFKEKIRLFLQRHH